MSDPAAIPKQAIADPVRVRRLRAAAARPLSVNLTETIALSHALYRIAAGPRPR